jgi:hypothetical protein
MGEGRGPQPPGGGGGFQVANSGTDFSTFPRQHFGEGYNRGNGKVSLFFVRDWLRRRAFSNDDLGTYLGTLEGTMVNRMGMRVKLENVEAAVNDLLGPVTPEEWNRWFEEQTTDVVAKFGTGNISGKDGFTSVTSGNEAMGATWQDNRRAAGEFAAIGVAIILEWNGNACTFVSPTSKVRFFFRDGLWKSAEGKVAVEAEGKAASAAMGVSKSGKLNAPHATDPVLKDAFRELWRAEDVRPGGTIGELLREVEAGGPLKHLEKARGRLRVFD